MGNLSVLDSQQSGPKILRPQFPTAAVTAEKQEGSEFFQQRHHRQNLCNRGHDPSRAREGAEKK